MNEQELLDRVSKVIVENAQPRRIVLFGSRARGNSKPDSDFDLLIIVPDGSCTEEIDRQIRRRLIDPDVSYDILVLTESGYRDKSREGWLLFAEIERDGKILYAA
jgi:predicted nucleotidyltransferase